MVTGDNIYTARAIALECDILKPGQSIDERTVIEGHVFRSYTEEERMNIADEISVSMHFSHW